MHRLSSFIFRPRHASLFKGRISRSFSNDVCTRDFFVDDSDFAAICAGDPKPDDRNANLKGWELVTKRAHDILEEVSERQFNKILHLYPDTKFVEGFGQSTKYSIAGCTSDEEQYELTKGMIQYQDSVSLVDFSEPLPYSLPHPTRDCDGSPLVSLDEIARVLNNDGFGIIGGPSRIWRGGMSDALDRLHNSGKLGILSIQFTEDEENKCLYYMAVIRGI